MNNIIEHILPVLDAAVSKDKTKAGAAKKGK